MVGSIVEGVAVRKLISTGDSYRSGGIQFKLELDPLGWRWELRDDLQGHHGSVVDDVISVETDWTEVRYWERRTVGNRRRDIWIVTLGNCGRRSDWQTY